MPDGLTAIKLNARANGVAVRTHWSNLAVTPAPWAPTVVANLTIDLLAAIAENAIQRPPERLIASGVLAAQAGEVEAAFARHGLRETDRRVQGEWAAVLLGVGVIRLAVRVARADAEAVLAELLELAPAGLEERQVGDDAIEYVLYGAPGELPDVASCARWPARRRSRSPRRRSPTTGPSAGRRSTGRST